MRIRKGIGIVGLLLAVPLLLASNGAAVAAGVEGEDYITPVGEEIPATNGARAWVSGCEVNDAAGTFPLQTVDGEMQGRYYRCEVGFVIEDGHQPGTTYSVSGEGIAATSAFKALGVQFVPSSGVDCEADALLPAHAGATGGGGTIGFDGEIGESAYAAGLTIGFQDTTCNVVRAPEPEPEPSEEPDPAEEEPTVIPEPTEEPAAPVVAERNVPVMGTCGFISLPPGLDAQELSDVMTNATPIPVTSNGINVTAYVTHGTFTSDLGNGPIELQRVDIYVIPELEYTSDSVLGKTWWVNGEAPQLDDLFRERAYTLSLDALLATPEMRAAGASGLTFTDQEFPEFDVAIGPDLTISTALFQSFMIQSGNAERPLVTADVVASPLPANCEVPVIEEPVVEEPVVDQPAPPRSVPESVQTGVGPDSSATLTGASMLGYLSLVVSLALFIGARVRRRRTL